MQAVDLCIGCEFEAQGHGLGDVFFEGKPFSPFHERAQFQAVSERLASAEERAALVKKGYGNGSRAGMARDLHLSAGQAQFAGKDVARPILVRKAVTRAYPRRQMLWSLIISDRERARVLHGSHKGRILGHEILVPWGKDKAVIRRADTGGITARRGHVVEREAENLGIPVQLELNLNGFSHPLVDGAFLPVIDDLVDLVGAREGVGIAEAAIAVVHNG